MKEPMSKRVQGARSYREKGSVVHIDTFGSETRESRRVRSGPPYHVFGVTSAAGCRRYWSIRTLLSLRLSPPVDSGLAQPVTASRQSLCSNLSRSIPAIFGSLPPPTCSRQFPTRSSRRAAFPLFSRTRAATQPARRQSCAGPSGKCASPDAVPGGWRNSRYPVD